MITEWLVAVGIGIGEWFLSLFPEWEIPPEIADFDGMVSGFVDDFGALAAWVPWALIFLCISLAISAYVIGFGVQGLRAVWSYVPFVGGSA